jgi:hypothetical protein
MYVGEGREEGRGELLEPFWAGRQSRRTTRRVKYIGIGYEFLGYRQVLLIPYLLNETTGEGFVLFG